MMDASYSASLRKLVAGIVPLDTQEAAAIDATLQWIDSGVELCRRQKPATPPEHLVSYFLLVDGEHCLLVDHINAELWLPTGGHVDPGEHPATTVIREAREELHMDAEFAEPGPVFLTRTVTVGRTAGHTDVSIWFVVKGDRSVEYQFDQSEFLSVRWFHCDDIPYDRADPEMRRFVRKYFHR